MLFKIVGKGFADGCLHGADDLVVAEFGLGLAFELRLHHLYRNHGREAVAEVFGVDFDLGVLEKVVVVGVFFQRGGEAAAEAGEVCAALDGVDVVDERVDVLVGGGVVGQGHFHGDAGALGVEVDDVVDERFFVGVDVFDKFTQAFFGVEGLGAGGAVVVALAQVGEGEADAGVEVGEVAQAVGEDAVLVNGGRENRAVGLEGHARAGGVAFSDDGEFARGLAAGVFLRVYLAVAAHVGAEICRECVHA